MSRRHRASQGNQFVGSRLANNNAQWEQRQPLLYPPFTYNHRSNRSPPRHRHGRHRSPSYSEYSSDSFGSSVSYESDHHRGARGFISNSFRRAGRWLLGRNTYSKSDYTNSSTSSDGSSVDSPRYHPRRDYRYERHGRKGHRAKAQHTSKRSNENNQSARTSRRDTGDVHVNPATVVDPYFSPPPPDQQFPSQGFVQGANVSLQPAEDENYEVFPPEKVPYTIPEPTTRPKKKKKKNRKQDPPPKPIVLDFAVTDVGLSETLGNRIEELFDSPKGSPAPSRKSTQAQFAPGGRTSHEASPTQAPSRRSSQVSYVGKADEEPLTKSALASVAASRRSSQQASLPASRSSQAHSRSPIVPDSAKSYSRTSASQHRSPSASPLSRNSPSPLGSARAVSKATSSHDGLSAAAAKGSRSVSPPGQYSNGSAVNLPLPASRSNTTIASGPLQPSASSRQPSPQRSRAARPDSRQSRPAFDSGRMRPPARRSSSAPAAPLSGTGFASPPIASRPALAQPYPGYMQTQPPGYHPYFGYPGYYPYPYNFFGYSQPFRGYPAPPNLPQQINGSPQVAQPYGAPYYGSGTSSGSTTSSSHPSRSSRSTKWSDIQSRYFQRGRPARTSSQEAVLGPVSSRGSSHSSSSRSSGSRASVHAVIHVNADGSKRAKFSTSGYTDRVTAKPNETIDFKNSTARIRIKRSR